MRLILGRSGTGKTQYAMEEVKKWENEEAYTKPLLYIVPEQASFEAERELIRRIGKKGIMNAQVLSFRRLAFRIFSEKGFHENMIGNAGKTMLVYSIMMKHEGELQLLKNVSKNIGLVDTVVKQLEELKRYHITPEMLENIHVENPYLQRKLSDLSLIYQIYEQKQSMDASDELTMLSQLLKEGSSLDGSKIWIDGFDGFTPQELEIIEVLERKAEVTVSLIYDEAELFAPNQKTIEKLKKIASIQETIHLEDSKRFVKKELEHLEENFLRFPYQKYSQKLEAISLTLMKNPYEEVENIACTIQDLVREKNYRYENIAILTRDIENYENLFQTIFSLYDIPYFLDDKRELYSQPLISLILSLFDICSHPFSYESMFSYLKTGFANVQDRQDIDLLENYVLKWGIRHTDWLKSWELPDVNLEKLNRIREEVITPILEFKQLLNRKKTVKEIAISLYQYLLNIHVYEQLQNKIEKLKEENQLELANEYAQVWNIVMNILDEMVEVLGEETISFEQFSNTLKMGISNHKMGIIPACKDQVMIGDIERTRNNHVKVLFVVGINDGVFPKTFAEEGFIDDAERNQLLERGIEIAQDTKKALLEENFNIYKALAVPSEKLFLSYPTATIEGKALRPSFFIQHIKNIFPLLQEESKVVVEDFPVVSKNGSFPHLLEKIRDFADGEELSQYWQEVYAWYEKEDQEQLEHICTALSYQNTLEYINKKLVQRLYGERFHTSVSQLEKFVSCPFAYYLRYGLSAKNREVYRLETPDLGSFLHEVIDRFATYILENDKVWRDLTKEECDQLVDQIVGEVLQGFKHNLLNSSSRLKQLSIKLKRLVKRMVWVITLQIKSGEFEVIGNEVEFGEDKTYPPIVITFPDKTQMILNGKIDRIDMAQTEEGNFIRIIDYKSSSKQIKLSDVYYGIQLQLLTYLDAIPMENIIPGGVFYLELNDPMMRANRDMSKEEIEQMILKELRMKGLVLANARLIKAIDQNMDKESNVIQLAVKKDGGYSKMPVATEEQFHALQLHIQNVLKEIGMEIMNGNVKNEPIKRKKATACTYCDYRLICQFDRKLGNCFRVLDELSDEEAMKKIVNEVIE